MRAAERDLLLAYTRWLAFVDDDVYRGVADAEEHFVDTYLAARCEGPNP